MRTRALSACCAVALVLGVSIPTSGIAQQADTAAQAAALYKRGISQFLAPHNAAKTFAEVIRLEPGSAAGYRGRAWANLAASRARDALPDFNKLVQLEPDDSEAYRGRAWAHLQMKRYERAARDFTESMRRGRNPAEAFVGRGLAYFLAGDKAAARADFRASMRYRVDFNDAWVYTRAGDFIVAPAVEYAGPQGLSPQNRQRLQFNPQLRADMSTRLDDAARYLRVRNVITQQRGAPGLDAALALAVISYRQLDDSPGTSLTGSARLEARAYFDRAVEADPRSVDALMARGMYRGTPEVADPDGAIADFTAAAALATTDVEPFLRRGMVLAAVGRMDEAIADCEKAVSLHPDGATIAPLCDEFRARKPQAERIARMRMNAARYRQRQREMDDAAWIAIGILIATVYSGIK